MVTRKQADDNMGEFSMTREHAQTLIDRARKGLPVTILDLQRAVLSAYKGKEPRKLLLPVMNEAQREHMNAKLLQNLANFRYHSLEEKLNASSGKDESAALCEADSPST